MHVPHIGETVLVHHKDCFSNGATTVPAIVQQIFNQYSSDPSVPILCNLIAFPPFTTPQHLGSVAWFGSVPHITDEHFAGCWPRDTHHTHVGEPDTANDEA